MTMTGTMHILCSKGDIQVTWDAKDPASIVAARAEVEELRQRGYTFFLVDGSPADEVQAGMASGSLTCRRITAEEVVDEVEAEPEQEQEPERSPNSDYTARPKGRKGKKGSKTVVATRPMAGG